ncbi:uncharacterized protein M421DRAFT_285717 [Didymella exigua CBS 183.55]|uniref:Uncharacterized protein n=1 Tax=Didymella exigua CBS 183.55 TaxID=1150837 RepID=A0A6A5RUM5_9PLEO|nr:uncharacterized protein M421DRAFT_285717 [Didymella exigua CBS 183.55]KAF1932165.1 hypothetical protein M421DRAFT_285717 [Didymella exigua CBS 183.55]
MSFTTCLNEEILCASCTIAVDQFLQRAAPKTRLDSVRRIEDVRLPKIKSVNPRDRNTELSFQATKNRDITPHIYILVTSTADARNADDVLFFLFDEVAFILTTRRVKSDELEHWDCEADDIVEGTCAYMLDLKVLRARGFREELGCEHQDFLAQDALFAFFGRRVEGFYGCNKGLRRVVSTTSNVPRLVKGLSLLVCFRWRLVKDFAERVGAG